MMFAQGMFDFGLNDKLLEIVRVIATVGGAVVGWFLCDPLTRIIYRISFRSATPAALLFMVKAGGALTLSLLIYFFIPLGGGGGPGFGPGLGGGPGKGPGKGGDKVAADGTAKADKTPKSAGTFETVEIEILGGKRFQDDGKDRFYLLKRAEPAVSLDELDDYFKKQESKIQVTAILTKDSGVGSELGGSPLDKLRKRAAERKIKVVTFKED